MEFHIKKSQFSLKSRLKESMCADGGHSLKLHFTVLSDRTLDRLILFEYPVI